MPGTKTLRTCPNGHQYYKSTDCPSCPICEKEGKPKNSFLSTLSAPARRALQHAGINSLQILAQQNEKEMLTLHGVGPATIPILRKALKEAGLNFKNT